MYEKLDYNMPEIIPFIEENKIRILKGIGEISKKYNLYSFLMQLEKNSKKISKLEKSRNYLQLFSLDD